MNQNITYFEIHTFVVLLNKSFVKDLKFTDFAVR